MDREEDAAMMAVSFMVVAAAVSLLVTAWMAGGER